jgi:hypothetical protein
VPPRSIQKSHLAVTAALPGILLIQCVNSQ